MPLTADSRCPCGSGEVYGECCGALHSGALDAASAEALMRSRFSAFAVGEPAYLLATWYPSTRPPTVDLDSERHWTHLEILHTTAGGAFDRTGVVEFRAHYRDPLGRGALRERSSFVREGGRWYYLAGEID